MQSQLFQQNKPWITYQLWRVYVQQGCDGAKDQRLAEEKAQNRESLAKPKAVSIREEGPRA